jgi:peroxiredoxin
MRKLYLVIPVSAIILTALVVFKRIEPRPSAQSVTPADLILKPAPPLRLFDDQSQLVRLERYLGRHKVVVVFFDGHDGPDRSPLLLELKQQFPPLHEAGAIVLAVSEATPFANRQGMERLDARFPFPLLSDPSFESHERWQTIDAETGRTRQAIFVIDRAGRIRLRQDVATTPTNWNEIHNALRLIP